jgi:hypothetical protein
MKYRGKAYLYISDLSHGVPRHGVPVHFTYCILYIMVYRGTAYLYFKFISWSTGVRRARTFHIYYSYVPRYGVPAQFIYYSHEPGWAYQ